MYSVKPFDAPIGSVWEHELPSGTVGVYVILDDLDPAAWCRKTLWIDVEAVVGSVYRNSSVNHCSTRVA